MAGWRGVVCRAAVKMAAKSANRWQRFCHPPAIRARQQLGLPEKKVEIITKMEFKEDLNQTLCFLRQFQALRC
uniref:Uncharacterized protein n=1 Tax=Candidozyma auris TaxID=498019 RepID=A0A0L0P016_CANAR